MCNLCVEADNGAQPALVIFLLLRVASDLEGTDKNLVLAVGDEFAVDKGVVGKSDGTEADTGVLYDVLDRTRNRKGD